MDKETLFWIFSTIAQVYGALIAILGVFTVYALEWLQQSIEWSRRDMVQQIKSIKPECKSKYIYLSLDGQLDYVKKTLQDTYSRKNNFDELIRITGLIYDRRVQREVFSKDFVTLISLFISVLIFSILGLFFVKNGAVTNTLLLIICPFGILSLFFIIAWIKDLLDRNTTEKKKKQEGKIKKAILYFLRYVIRYKEKSWNEERKEEFDKAVKKFREKIKQQEKNKINTPPPPNTPFHLI
ncbi:hypothetical protein KAU39_07600 [bacterium]|nr:hypothetical protein [bacterium]